MPNMRTSRLAVAFVAGLSLAFAGCGGDDGNSTTATTSSSARAPTKAAYVTQANAICTKSRAAASAAAKKAFPSGQPSEDEITKYLKETFIPAIDDLVEQLRALTPPKGDGGTTKAIYDAVQAAADKAQADPKVLNATGAESPFADANKQANAYGLTVCGAE